MGPLTHRILRVFYRAWITTTSSTKPRAPRAWGWPDDVLILDTETTVDPSQRLIFGSWRIGHFGRHGTFECQEEGILYPDDLPTRDPKGFARLQAYVTSHRPATTNRRRQELLLVSRREFASQRLWKALDSGALVVGYNLAFDLTRLAVGVGAARHPLFQGGFSLWMFDYEKDGVSRLAPFRPRIWLKALHSKRTLMGVGGRQQARPGEGQARKDGRVGRMLDLKHLTFALTDRHLSLAGAAKAFGLEVGKLETEHRGEITAAYLEYNRRDVEVTARLLEAVRAEWDRHPVALSPDKVMSPAGLGKGYLRAMGIVPPALKFTHVGPERLGICMSAYYGGRSGVRGRRQRVPVVYTDFLSMYPTVNALLSLSRMLTAERLGVEDATADVQALVTTVTLSRVLDPACWSELRFFARIQPDGDILPVRAAYGADDSNPTIGLNPVSSPCPVWVAGPDLVASVLLGGPVPTILEAFRLVPVGRQDGLRPVMLRGQVEIDPTRDDIFQKIIEARQVARQRPDLPKEERERLQKFLKVLANSTSYGIYAELNPQPVAGEGSVAVEVYGGDGMFPASTSSPEDPGEFCFPPFAALTTAGARLMLALLETAVRDEGGEIAFGDTDSAAIVATETGGLVSCVGGPERLADGRPAVRALSWGQVRAIVERFRSLSPYDREIVPGSILKIEDKNFDPVSGVQRTVYAFAISAKRYALFLEEPDGTIEVIEAKEHGLGHLLWPYEDTRSEKEKEADRERGRLWIREVWAGLIREAGGEPLVLPDWVDLPAMTRVGITTMGLYRTYESFNAGKAFDESVKPMNFGLSPTVARFGHPEGVDPAHFHLLGPFERRPERWLTMAWVDKYSGRVYRIGVGRATPPDHVQVKSYRDVILEYRVHPEPKSLDPEGKPCGRASPVEVGEVRYIGKESNEFEQVEQGLIHHREDVQPTYAAPGRDRWDLVYLPAIARISPKRLVKIAGVGHRQIYLLRNRQRRPSPQVEARLCREVHRWARRVMRLKRVSPEDRQVAERVLASRPPAPQPAPMAAIRPSRRRTSGKPRRR